MKKGEFVLSSDLVPLPPRLRETQAGPEILLLAFYALSAPKGVGQNRIHAGTGRTQLGSHGSQLNRSGNVKPSHPGSASGQHHIKHIKRKKKVSVALNKQVCVVCSILG